MPMPLPEGKLFYIEHRILPSNYEMPSLEVALDQHYELVYHISGDRTIITPSMIYTSHAGCVTTPEPHMYLRTMPASTECYENILVKFSPLFVSNLTDRLGVQILDQIYEHTVNTFSEDTQPRIHRLFFDMLEEYRTDAPYSQIVLECLLEQLLLTILQRRLPDPDDSMHQTPLTPPVLEAVYYLERNYAMPLKIEEAARKAGYSIAYFSRLFQTQLGKSFSEYLQSVRIKHAQSLLLNTDKSIMTIALETGYQYPGNLTAAFKKQTGMTPLHYRMSKGVR